MAINQTHDMLVTLACHAGRGLGEHHMRAEHPGLLTRPARELMPADAMGEAWIVPDHRAAARLAARDRFLQHDRLEAFGRGVDGSGQAGRPSPDDGDIAFADVYLGAAAD